MTKRCKWFYEPLNQEAMTGTEEVEGWGERVAPWYTEYVVQETIKRVKDCLLNDYIGMYTSKNDLEDALDDIYEEFKQDV